MAGYEDITIMVAWRIRLAGFEYRESELEEGCNCLPLVKVAHPGDSQQGRILSVILFFCFTLCVSPGHGLELTMANHLFDITGTFNQPSDVTVAGDGTIYVVDGVNGRVQVFDATGGYKLTIGRPGTEQGELAFPLGIDLDGLGNVYVADSRNHRIQIFTPMGDFISEIPIPDKDGKKSDPTDVAVDTSGNICFVADNDNHYLLEIDIASKKIVNSYGKPGAEKWQFRYPFLMHLHQNRYLYVVDVINTRVQVVSTDGKFVAFVGGWGVEKGQFFRPKGVTVDKDGLAYVSDSYLGVIQLFDITGHFHSVLGDPETGKVKKFNTPVGLFVDESNRLYVVEMIPGRLSVFSLEKDE
ncbi:MAG: DNA-binding beta-propeller fold protein YncE [Desulforhopalus sp.]|jgi:DNA-binding beta-propeller fold protein YncE